MGFIKSKIAYGHEVIVNKPISEAWSVLQDETKMADWLAGFKSIEHLSGDKGAVGSTYKVIVNPGEGQADFEMIETLKSIKENDHIRLELDSEMMLFDQTTRLETVDGGTKITTESLVKGKGIMMRSMFAIMDLFTDSFTKQEVENIEKLKVTIESNTKQY